MASGKLLWMDLEMTGLSPEQDEILEVAVVVTDWELNQKAQYHAVVKVDEQVIKSRMVGDFWQKNAETYRQLIWQNQKGKSSEEVEAELIDLIKKEFYAGERVILAGNSIHQDRKFIDRYWPKLAERLHYRMLDVSAWKVYFEGARKQFFVKKEEHRAMEDILGSIEELKWYRGFLKENKND